MTFLMTLNAVTLAEYAWLAAMASATSYTRSTVGSSTYPSALASGSEGSYFPAGGIALGVADQAAAGPGQHVPEAVPPVHRLEDRNLPAVRAAGLGAGGIHIGYVLADDVQPQLLSRHAAPFCRTSSAYWPRMAMRRQLMSLLMAR